MSQSSNTVYLIPTIPSPQTLSIALSNVTYNLRFTYQNAGGSGWMLDISDAINNLIVGGIPLVTGADLLAQYRYLGFVGGLYVTTAGDPLAVPTFTNLGSDANIYYIPD